MKSTELTRRQKEVLAAIHKSIDRRGRPPTLRELCHTFGWASDNAARQHLRLMAQKGAIELDPHSARGIKLPARHRQETKPVPLVGRVAAGQPIEAIENMEGNIGVDASLFPEADVFALTVQGDSMSGIGIRDQDIALVKRQSTAKKDDIVVAVVDGEATVKRYLPEKGRIRLQAENPDYKDILIRPDAEAEIAGLVIGILRRM